MAYPKSYECAKGILKKLIIAVAVSLYTDDFSGGSFPEDGGDGWDIDGVLYAQNPKALLTELDLDMVRVWRMYQSKGMGGQMLLPDAGGIMDQAAIMLDALQIMDAAYHRLSKKDE